MDIDIEKEKSAQEISEEFLKNCGELIRIELSLEDDIEFFISNYFIYPQKEGTFLLEDWILTKLNFERKKQILEKICKKENIDMKILNELMGDITCIQNLRNKVAHWEATVDDYKEGIKLNRRRHITYKKDELKITPELVKSIDNKKIECSKKIFRILDDVRKRKGGML
jgi:hypothetical protein